MTDVRNTGENSPKPPQKAMAFDGFPISAP